MKLQNQKKQKLIIAIMSVLVFSGCDLLKKEKSGAADSVGLAHADSSQVLFSIDGKPVITQQKFEGHLQKIIASNPQVQGIIDSVPAMKYNIFSGMASQELLKTWAEKTELTKKPEYQQERALMAELIEYELARKYFHEDVAKGITISATDVQKYYDAHKDAIPDLLEKQGGVKAVAIAFDNQVKADQFVKQENIKAHFQAKAKEQNLAVKDLGLVNNFSVGVDKQIKLELAKVQAAPKIIKIKGDDGKFWVCLAQEKQAPVYRPLAQVQGGIENALKQERMQIVFGQKLEALKIAFKAEENKSWFQQQQNPMQELLAQQQEPEQAAGKSAGKVA